MKLTINCAIFVYSIVCAVVSSTDIGVYIKLINELVKNEDRPSLLKILSCWSQQENAHLLRFSIAPVAFLHSTHKVNVTQVDEQNKLWFVVSMSCDGTWDFLRQVSSLTLFISCCCCCLFFSCYIRVFSQTDGKYFARPYNWILLDSTDGDRDGLVQLNIMLDSNIILVPRVGHVKNYSIEQVFKREQTPDALVVEEFGSWSHGNGLQDSRETRILARRRRNLMGMQLIASMVILHNDSLNHLTDFKYIFNQIACCSSRIYIYLYWITETHIWTRRQRQHI